jgi:hypothetical protein
MVARRKVADWDAVGLGTMSDRALAAELGVCCQNVQKQRTRRGIPAFGGNDGKTAPRGVDWDAQPLGVLPDWRLAKRLGVSAASVQEQRAKRGIPRHRPS